MVFKPSSGATESDGRVKARHPERTAGMVPLTPIRSRALKTPVIRQGLVRNNLPSLGIVMTNLELYHAWKQAGGEWLSDGTMITPLSMLKYHPDIVLLEACIESGYAESREWSDE